LSFKQFQSKNMLQNSFLITAFKETKTIQKCLAGLVDETLSVAKEVY